MQNLLRFAVGKTKEESKTQKTTSTALYKFCVVLLHYPSLPWHELSPRYHHFSGTLDHHHHDLHLRQLAVGGLMRSMTRRMRHRTLPSGHSTMAPTTRMRKPNISPPRPDTVRKRIYRQIDYQPVLQVRPFRMRDEKTPST